MSARSSDLTYDALLLVSFGGPEGVDDVMPFLENVLRGRNVPRARMLEVAKHYELFGGVSPINEQNRKLIAALQQELDTHGPKLPIYFGNRNWHPLLHDALRTMREDGIKRALAFVTSAYSSYSSCRQYVENIAAAQLAAGPGGPIVEKIRAFYNHPGFIRANADHVRAALENFSAPQRASVHICFTAHSIPESMAQNCDYHDQLLETARLVAGEVGSIKYSLAYQSRSGSPMQPWLGPDIGDHLKELKLRGVDNVVVAPIGFISDHMEIVYDLDLEARELCEQVGLNMWRARTAGTHPAFIEMIRELIRERLDENYEPAFLGVRGAPRTCALDCCMPGNEGSRSARGPSS